MVKQGTVKETVKQKKIYLEALRILAVFWVFYNHTSSYGWLLFREWSTFLPAEPSKPELCVNVILFVFCKIGVPLFLMISGAVLLGKNESLPHLLKKRVSRFLILIVIVTLVRGVYLHHIGHVYMAGVTTFWEFLRKAWSSTELCTYYLFLYIGFLLALPALRLIAQKRELIPYILAVYILFQEILPVLESVFGLGKNNIAPYIGLLVSVSIPGEQEYGSLKHHFESISTDIWRVFIERFFFMEGVSTVSKRDCLDACAIGQLDLGNGFSCCVHVPVRDPSLHPRRKKTDIEW